MVKAYQIIYTYTYYIICLFAGSEGIEPTSTVLETAVLPLNYKPIVLVYHVNQYEDSMDAPFVCLYQPKHQRNFYSCISTLNITVGAAPTRATISF